MPGAFFHEIIQYELVILSIILKSPPTFLLMVRKYVAHLPPPPAAILPQHVSSVQSRIRQFI